MADATLNEIRQRLTRVESRICRIADHLGANVGSPAKNLQIVPQSDDSIVIVSTPVLDVTISEVIHFLHKEGITGKVAFINFNGADIATIYMSLGE
jgi:hypothetical protein